MPDDAAKPLDPILGWPSQPIPVDMSLLRGLSARQIQQQITRIVRSTVTELDADAGTLRLLGPDTSYHRADPHLPALLSAFEPAIQLSQLGTFRSSRPCFDLCLEDSWTGFFVAGGLRTVDPRKDLVLVHLDDHTDMMSTMLAIKGEGLVDPARAAPFRPERPEDWQLSIQSGCIGIGSFVTALLLLDRQVHVRHLNNAPATQIEPRDVVLEAVEYPLLPGKRFAATRNVDPGSAGRLGTYLGGPDAAQVLHSMPPGHVVVHIDLDYFINDFNGNVGSAPALSVAEQRLLAQHKLESFFRALDTSFIRVESWIIATSPGFCSIIHWDWLLSAIEDRIRGSVALRPNRGQNEA